MTGSYTVCTLGPTFVFATLGDGLAASLLWGAPTATDMRAMVTGWREHPFARPLPFLFDASAVSKVDADAFLVVRDYQVTHAALLAAHVERMAIVAPATQSGATIAGFSILYTPPYATSVTTTRDEALRWLACEHFASLTSTLATDLAGDDTLGALRRWLFGAELEAATLATSARAIALSSRSLQRRLAEAGTTFDHERVRAQIARARHLMRTTTLSLTEIAAAVGCATSSSFSDLFRRETGEPPSAWRARHGRAP